jgi:hypothetical protein
LVGKNAFSLVPPEDAPGLRSRMAEKTGSASSVAPMSFRLRHRDGSWRAFEAAGSRRDAATEDGGGGGGGGGGGAPPPTPPRKTRASS